MFGIVFWIAFFFIFYLYFGYPVLISFVSKLKHPESYSNLFDDDLPTVTLLVAAYNEEVVIETKIKNSLLLIYPPGKLEIIIVDDCSEDKTAEIIDQYASDRIHIYHQSERHGKVSAINCGVSFAKGEIILSTDANIDLDANALKALIPPFQNSKVAVVTGARIVRKQEKGLAFTEGSYWKYESFIKKSESRFGSCTATGDIVAFRKRLYQPLPEYIITDDLYLSLVMVGKGYQVKYASGAKAYEYVSPSAADEMQRRKRIVSGRYQSLKETFRILPWKQNPAYIWMVFSHKFMRPLAAPAMILMLLANILACIFPVSGSIRWIKLSPPIADIFLFLQVIFYAMAILGNVVKMNKGLSKVLYIPTFLVNSNLIVFPAFIRFLKKNQNVRWQKVERVIPEQDEKNHE